MDQDVQKTEKSDLLRETCSQIDAHLPALYKFLTNNK